MNKLLHIGSTFKDVKTMDDGSVKVVGYATTQDVDRAGDVISPKAWTNGGLENYKKNPILLFNHNGNEPVGRASNLEIDDKGLKIEATISKAAGKVLDFIKESILNTFSVGFLIKDADYISETDGFFIKEAELYEVSVVSVPCNQDAVFSLAKSFETEDEYREFIKQHISNFPAEQPAENSVNAQYSAGERAESPKKEIEMNEEDLQNLVKNVASETAKSVAEKTKTNEVVSESTERLIKEVENRINTKNEDLEKTIGELKEDLNSKASELEQMKQSKRVFANRGGDGDWKSQFKDEAVDSYILGLVSGKGWNNTKRGQELMEKVNTHSGIEVPSADFEQVVSENIEQDIQNKLVLAPLFRELPMTSASMIMPILPDAGYAEFTSNATASGTAPDGNLDMRSASYGDNAGVNMNEHIITTKKLCSKSFLGNETEEDAIIPMLPLLKESMVRSHARAVEHAILLGNHADGVYGTSGAAPDGLVSIAADDSHTIQDSASGFDSSVSIAAAELLDLRKKMGKYGVRPEEVVYIVSQEVYYNLLEDTEFQDANLVGEMTATKNTGSIGSVYGSDVLICDEFAPKAAGKFHSIAVNTRNFVIPRLRGLTVESDYQVGDQRRVLVASQRMGFIDVINGASAVYAKQYDGA